MGRDRVCILHRPTTAGEYHHIGYISSSYRARNIAYLVSRFYELLNYIYSDERPAIGLHYAY